MNEMSDSSTLGIGTAAGVASSEEKTDEKSNADTDKISRSKTVSGQTADKKHNILVAWLIGHYKAFSAPMLLMGAK